MADEVKIAFGLPGEPGETIKQWKASPPAFLSGYKLEDEAYDSLVYRAHVMGKGMKILMFGMADTVYTLDVNFGPRDGGATRVTMTGQAKEDVQSQIGAFLRESTEPL
jgi:hypothetical protein